MVNVALWFECEKHIWQNSVKSKALCSGRHTQNKSTQGLKHHCHLLAPSERNIVQETALCLPGPGEQQSDSQRHGQSMPGELAQHQNDSQRTGGAHGPGRLCGQGLSVVYLPYVRPKPPTVSPGRKLDQPDPQYGPRKPPPIA